MTYDKFYHLDIPNGVLIRRCLAAVHADMTLARGHGSVLKAYTMGRAADEERTRC